MPLKPYHIFLSFGVPDALEDFAESIKTFRAPSPPPPPPWQIERRLAIPHILVRHSKHNSGQTPFCHQGHDDVQGFRGQSVNEVFDSPPVSEPLEFTCMVIVSGWQPQFISDHAPRNPFLERTWNESNSRCFSELMLEEALLVSPRYRE